MFRVAGLGLCKLYAAIIDEVRPHDHLPITARTNMASSFYYSANESLCYRNGAFPIKEHSAVAGGELIAIPYPER
jgi:hypothetical protein